MGEIVHRMDYELWAKNLVRQDPKLRFRSGEYSQSVKSKNAQAVRTGEEYVKRAATDLNNFHSKHSGEVYRLQDLKKSIDSKLMDFNPRKFKKTVGQLTSNTPKPDQLDKSKDVKTQGPNMQKPKVLAKKKSVPVIIRSHSEHPSLQSRTMSAPALLDLKNGVTPRPLPVVKCTPWATQLSDQADGPTNDVKEQLKRSRSFRSIRDSLKLQQMQQPNMKELRLKHYKDKEVYNNEILDQKVQMLCLQLNTMRSNEHANSKSGVGEPTSTCNLCFKPDRHYTLWM